MDAITSVLTPGNAAVVLLVNSLAWKLYMAAVWHDKINKAKDAAEVATIKGSAAFINSSSAQLNEAEWTPVLLAPLLFLALKGAKAPVASALAAFGSVMYPTARIVIGGFAPLGAGPRFLALGMLSYAVYGAL